MSHIHDQQPYVTPRLAARFGRHVARSLPGLGLAATQLATSLLRFHRVMGGDFAALDVEIYMERYVPSHDDEPLALTLIRPTMLSEFVTWLAAEDVLGGHEAADLSARFAAYDPLLEEHDPSAARHRAGP